MENPVRGLRVFIRQLPVAVWLKRGFLCVSLVILCGPRRPDASDTLFVSIAPLH